MRRADVMHLLAQNENPRGVAKWAEMNDEATGGLTSFGIGLTQLRKLARKIGRDHTLALELWDSDCYDARVIGLLIDDPKQLDRKQVEQQVEEVGPGLLSHVFSSCDATLAKAPFALEVAREWIESPDPLRRRCGWGLIYELSKLKGKKAPDDEFFRSCIKTVEGSAEGQPRPVREAMKAALMGIGKRTKELNSAAIAAAKKVSQSEPDKVEGCPPIDALKHLTNPDLKQRLGIV